LANSDIAWHSIEGREVFANMSQELILFGKFDLESKMSFLLEKEIML